MSNDTHPFHFSGADGTRIAAYRWPSLAPVKAVVQISHGMGEHAARYPATLKPLREAGVALYANDHRGHGRTAEVLGDFGPGGFAAVVDDMARLSEIARQENPGVPLILLGHSMGSFALQIYLVSHSG
ncbi:MAG: alpha/beta hydrolase, partial [Micropepsaceae bacterium]